MERAREVSEDQRVGVARDHADDAVSRSQVALEDVSDLLAARVHGDHVSVVESAVVHELAVGLDGDDGRGEAGVLAADKSLLLHVPHLHQLRGAGTGQQPRLLRPVHHHARIGQRVRALLGEDGEGEEGGDGARLALLVESRDVPDVDDALLGGLDEERVAAGVDPGEVGGGGGQRVSDRVDLTLLVVVVEQHRAVHADRQHVEEGVEAQTRDRRAVRGKHVLLPQRVERLRPHASPQRRVFRQVVAGSSVTHVATEGVCGDGGGGPLEEAINAPLHERVGEADESQLHVQPAVDVRGLGGLGALRHQLQVAEGGRRGNGGGNQVARALRVAMRRLAGRPRGENRRLGRSDLQGGVTA